jgi:tetratricopeptide (TPR) repeat protein
MLRLFFSQLYHLREQRRRWLGFYAVVVVIVWALFRAPVPLLLALATSLLVLFFARWIAQLVAFSRSVLGFRQLRTRRVVVRYAPKAQSRLLSVRCGELPPAFKSEGLATWCQVSWRGKPVDFHALVLLRGGQCMPLPWFMRRSAFYPGGRWSYMLAGSFTGHLVRRFGWDDYLRFYRAAAEDDLEVVFRRTFREPLSEVERQWRADLFAQAQSTDPELEREVRRTRVVAAYGALHLYACVEQADALIHVGEASAETLWVAAQAYVLLGNYGRAIELLNQARERAQEGAEEDAWLGMLEASVLLQLGQLHGLKGDAESAVAAYRRALRAPDWWDRSIGSAQAQARQFLERAKHGRMATEVELIEPMRKGFAAHWRRIA